MANKSEWVDTLIDAEFDALFTNIKQIEELKSNTITLSQSERLRGIKESLSDLLNEYVNQNK